MPRYQLGENAIPVISGTAARATDGKVYLALVNTHPGQAETVTVKLSGMEATGVSGQLLTAPVTDTHNTVDNLEAIAPREYSASAEGGDLILEIPAKAVLVVSVD